jgi:Fe-S-cluster-containing dehydrogenase component
VIAYNISISCNHCEKPVCLEACPAKAIEKAENGIVTIDSELCMGCKYCAWTCPYSALQYDEERGVMTKCDMCLDYVSQGKNPACVDACPARALEFGEYNDLRQEAWRISTYLPMPDQRITLPSKLITPHKNARKNKMKQPLFQTWRRSGMNSEGALIAFTLFSQMIIGSVLAYLLVYFISMDDISQLSSGFSLKTPEFLLLLGMLVPWPYPSSIWGGHPMPFMR